MRKISMKRKSKSEANNSAEEADLENVEENGQDLEENEVPKKKGRKSKKGKKNDAESNGTEDNAAASSTEDNDEDYEVASPSKKKGSKKGKKGKKSLNESNGTEKNSEEDEEAQYEVETVLDQRTVKGAKQYLIRWKGYGADSDTWEPESTLSCPDLIEKFLNSQKTPSKSKKRGTPGSSSKKSSKKSKADSEDDGDDDAGGAGEYEVDRIIEVHHKKNGKREFLVHWKGYGNKDNTWEPEENMNCPDLIDRFMAKVDRAREADTRELRMDRKPTKMFTLSMGGSGRRLSRRNLGKQRAQYKETD